MKYRNDEVVARFLEHKEACSHSDNLTSIECGSALRLYSYSTCMAEWKDGILYVNTSKYSVTTSKHTYNLRHYASNHKVVPVDCHGDRGIVSLFTIYERTVGRADKKKHDAFYAFRKSILNFVNTRGDLLADDTVELLKSLFESSRKNSYKAQQKKFNLIYSNLSCNKPRHSLSLRMNHRILRSVHGDQQQFSF